MFSQNTTSKGIALLWNDENLTVEPYNLNKKIYYCGKELLQFQQGKTLTYQILSIDYDEVAFAKVYSDAEIDITWHEHSCIPKKQKSGGQSAKRFSQNRKNEIKAWYKKIDRFLLTQTGEIHLDISFVYHKEFMEHLHTYNKAKIISQTHTGYSGKTGIYQMINKLEKDKGLIHKI